MNENTLSANLERIKNAVDNIRITTDKPTQTIEEVAAAVDDLKLKGVTVVQTVDEMEYISNPQNGDICIVNDGPKEIPGNSETINTNFLIFKEEIDYPYELVDLDDEIGITGADLAVGGTITDSSHGLVGQLRISYDNVDVDVRYDFSETNKWRIAHMNYTINGEPQTILNGVIKLPFCIQIIGDGSEPNPQYDVIGLFIHTYETRPWTDGNIISHNGVIMKSPDFTLSEEGDSTKTIEAYFEGNNLHDSLYMNNTTLNKDTDGHTTIFNSSDGRYYTSVGQSIGYTYNLLYSDVDEIQLRPEVSSSTNTYLLSEVFSYIPSAVFKLYEFEANTIGGDGIIKYDKDNA